MPTLRLSDTLLDGCVALFDLLGPQDQTILLNKLRELMRENDSFPEKQNDEENSDDVDQRQTL